MGNHLFSSTSHPSLWQAGYKSFAYLSPNYSLKATSASWYASGQSKQLWGNKIIGTEIHTLYSQAAVMLDVFHWHHDTGRFCPAPDRGRFWPISALDSNLRCNILGPDGRPWRLFVNWGWGLIRVSSVVTSVDTIQHDASVVWCWHWCRHWTTLDFS